MSSQSPTSAAASRQWADRIGVCASALCFVHCLLTPVLLSASAVFAHLLPSEERTHRGLAVLVAAVGAFAVVVGFRKHRRVRVLLLTAAGLLLIGGAAWFGDRLPSHAMEVTITLVGSSLMIAAHRLNHTFCQSCECAESCGEAPDSR